MLGLQYESNFQQLLTLLRILENLSNSKEYKLLNDKEFSNQSIIENERINKVFNYVKNNYKEKVCLNEASNLVFMTTPSFCRYFKKHTGKTFIKFVNEYRINNALKLLAQSEIDIKNICYKCGFNNFSHFNRLFKKTIKITPSEYRKKINSIE
jgi:AraC-like DNA-binding protein